MATAAATLCRRNPQLLVLVWARPKLQMWGRCTPECCSASEGVAPPHTAGCQGGVAAYEVAEAVDAAVAVAVVSAPGRRLASATV